MVKTKKNSLRQLLLAALIAISGLLCLSVFAELDFDRLRQALDARFGNTYGSGPGSHFDDWRQMLRNAQNANETEKVRRVNDFFNKLIRYDTDWNVWGQADYWATPLETIGLARGDCEDYAIAKYYSLLNLGVSMQKLRMVYVRATINTPEGVRQEAHMVLAYYNSPSAEPVVLDSLVNEIRSASQRPDLQPIFSFNSSGLWRGTGNQTSQSNLSRWQDLQSRAQAEGF